MWNPTSQAGDDIVVTAPCTSCHASAPPARLLPASLTFNGICSITRFPVNVLSASISMIGCKIANCVDVSDPDSWKGKTTEELEEAAKETGYSEEQKTKGEGGKRFVRPNSGGRQIGIMPGNPANPDPVKQGPYVRVLLDGPGGTKNPPPIPLIGNGAL